MRSLFLNLTIIISCVFSNRALALDVTYISQTLNLTPYWHKSYAVARAAAKDLDINLTIIEGQGHHLLQAEVIEKLASSSVKPDLLIFHAYKQNAHEYLNLLEQAQIPFVTYSQFYNSSSLSEDEPVNTNQSDYKYWLSEYHVENKQGAALLVHRLIQQAKKIKNPQNKELKLVAFSGDLIKESLERSQGVAEQVKREQGVVLVQDIVANWFADDAQNKFKILYQRHKGIDIVWSSSDSMALGALAAAVELGLQPNKDIFIGGFDWNSKAISKIKEDQLTASAGGQFYNIAWLLVQVYDHFNRQAPFSKSSRVNDKYSIIDKNNLNKFEKLTDTDILPAINFYCFTKTYTQQNDYDFSMENLLKQANRKKNQQCN
ncbi:ABC transporter substrate-binding protein [Colwelliaceae bacterium MEBiC 14330]